MNTLIIFEEFEAFISFAYEYPCMDARIDVIRSGKNKCIRY
jgi:hypothetical protein|tara:strand:+ start:2415 stop:2537 length:123 start_codon:yes stop_codon:yes gene_type:complete